MITSLLASNLTFAQNLVQSWTDPCTGETKTIVVPSNGTTVVSIYNQTRVVTTQDILNGSLTSWIASAYQTYSALGPCSQSETQTQATNQAVQQTAQQAATAATAASTAAPPVPTTSTPPPTQTAAPTTSTPNTTTNGNNQNTSSGSTAQGSNQSSTDSGNTSGGGTDNSNSSSGTDGGSTDTSQDNQGSTESQGSDDTNTSSSESNNEESSSTSEGGEDQSNESTSDEQNNEESSTEDGESDKGGDETEEKDSGESSDDEQESEEESVEEESEEETEEETTEEEEEEEKQNDNPPIVVANISTMEGLDRSFSTAMTFGISKTSLRGDKSYGLTSMVWSNLKQYMLMGNFSKTFFVKGKPKIIYSAGLMGGRMFTTLMGGVNHSAIYLADKGSIFGLSLGATTLFLNYQIKEVNILVDQALLSGVATSFWTKSYNFDRYSVSPMLAISSPFITWDMYNKDTTYNKDLTIITGASANYALTQRFVLNLGLNITHNTNKQIRSLLNFTIGSRFSF